jgi:hypothetical protein
VLNEPEGPAVLEEISLWLERVLPRSSGGHAEPALRR